MSSIKPCSLSMQGGMPEIKQCNIESGLGEAKHKWNGGGGVKQQGLTKKENENVEKPKGTWVQIILFIEECWEVFY